MDKISNRLIPFWRDSYLLLVDYTSHFSIVCKLKTMTAQHIADYIKQIFAKYGWPNTIVHNQMV